MKDASQIRVVDITRSIEFRDYLYQCITGPPSKASKSRVEYLAGAIPKGFIKKLLIVNDQIVGQIEYSPADASYYPITGENVVVLNCIWVLRRARGHEFGRLLLEEMIKSEKKASSFATIALEDHWSQWFRKDQMQRLGFKPLDSMRVTHKLKDKRAFLIHLMWMPNTEKAKPPSWDPKKMLEGITSCTAHPLYHRQDYQPIQILNLVRHQPRRS